MCEPVTATLIGLAGSAAAAGLNYAGQEAQVSAQNKANQDWVNYQTAAAQRNTQADQASQQRAEAARQNTLNQLTPQAATDAQTGTATRLQGEMAVNNPAYATDPNTQLLSGQAQNPDTSVTTDIAQRITNASRAAQGRIAALANLQGYTGGYGSATDTAQRALMQGGQAIGLQGDIQRGNNAVLGIAQNVPVKQYVQGQNIAGGIANSLGALAGGAFQQSSLNPLPKTAGSLNKGIQ